MYTENFSKLSKIKEKYGVLTWYFLEIETIGK